MRVSGPLPETGSPVHGAVSHGPVTFYNPDRCCVMVFESLQEMRDFVQPIEPDDNNLIFTGGNQSGQADELLKELRRGKDEDLLDAEQRGELSCAVYVVQLRLRRLVFGIMCGVTRGDLIWLAEKQKATAKIVAKTWG